MNKRAITEIGIMTIIFGILVAMAIATTFPVISRLLFGGGGEARTAEVALESVHQAILSILQKEVGQFEAIRNFPVFIQANTFIIVAFNADDDKVQSGCYDESITRPTACQSGQTCLCLYADTYVKDFGNDLTTNPPRKCVLLPKTTLIVAPANKWEALEPGKNDPQKFWNLGVMSGAPSVKQVNAAGGGPIQQYLSGRYEYENLLFYGQCDETVWNKQDVYIEKFTSGGIDYVYIAHESPLTTDRHVTLRKAFPASPTP